MIIEVRSKLWISDGWVSIQTGLKFEDVDIDAFSVRINKDRQYHRADTPGFKEAYNKAMFWLMLHD